MSLSKKGLAALRTHVAEVHGASADLRDELVQAALQVALERDPSAAEGELLRLAKEALPALVKAEGNRLRRGGGVRESTEADEPLPQPVHRLKRRPHLPKGLVSVLDATGAHVVPVETGDAPDLSVIVAARRLVAEVADPISRGESLHPKRRKALLQAYRTCFGGTPEGAWAAILTQEIQGARRALLATKEAAARQNQKQPDRTSIAFAKSTEGRARYPHLPPKFVRDVRQVLRWTDGVRATFDLVGDLDGETRVLGSISGAFDDAPLLPSSATPLSQAPSVLERAAARSADFGCRPPLPAYVRDPSLIAWLIERVSFDGGGRGRLSGPSIERLLLQPLALALEVDEYGLRHANRLSKEDARRAARGYKSIAARIRAGARSGT